MFIVYAIETVYWYLDQSNRVHGLVKHKDIFSISAY
jgi:hypothetical protein